MHGGGDGEDEDQELSQSDFLGSNQEEEEEEGVCEQEGHGQYEEARDADELDDEMQLEYFRQR